MASNIAEFLFDYVSYQYDLGLLSLTEPYHRADQWDDPV